jgi:hypothetical protein
MTAEEIKNIFYSGQAAAPEWDLLDELSKAIDNGEIRVRKFVFAQRTEYEQAQSNTTDAKEAYRLSGHGGEQPGHYTLKHLAEQFVKGQGKEPVIDQEVNGLYPDLFAKDLTLIVECGNTNVAKVVEYFAQLPQLDRLVILPYPFYEQTALNGYEFSKGPSFQDLIDRRNDTLRNAFLKARGPK